MKLFYFSIIIFFSIFSIAQSPTFEWAKSIGGPNADEGSSITVDLSGNVYTSGYFTGIADFDPSSGVYNLSTGPGLSQVFVSKLDASGNFLWARKLYTSIFFSTRKTVVKTDFLGSVYVACYDSVTKLTPSGSIVWTKSTGTGGENSDIALDATGNIYITGAFKSLVDFDPSSNIDTIRAVGPAYNDDIFILKLDNMGNYIWAKSMGGAIYDFSYSIAVDPLGYIYTTGWFSGISDFDPGVGTYTLSSSSSSRSMFISKLDPSGNFVFAKNILGWSEGKSIRVDNSSNIYVAGSQGSGGFVYKFDANGAIVWVESTGGNSRFSVNIDAANNVYTMGQFTGTSNFNSGGLFTLTATGGNNDKDVFISKFDNNGNFIWASSFGGPYEDKGYTMVNDGTGNIYVAGYYSGICDFDVGAGTFTMSPQAGSSDAFVLKLGNNVIGVQELSKNNTLIIYPNPNNGVVTIKTSSEGSYQLINALGQTIKSFQLNTDNNFTVTIDELPQGIYTLVGKENNQTVSQKIIVIK